VFPSAWRRVSPLGNLISTCKSLVTRFSLQGGWMVEILTAAVSHSDGQGTLRWRTSLRSRLMLSCRSFISNRISRVGLHWSHSYSRIRNRESSVLGLPFTSIAWSPVWFLCPSGEPMFCQLSLFWAIKWIWKEAFLDLLSTDLPGRRKITKTGRHYSCSQRQDSNKRCTEYKAGMLVPTSQPLRSLF
jgi:hypothetical protein